MLEEMKKASTRNRAKALCIKSFQQDLNLRPLPYHGSALPAELWKHKMAPQVGFEPTTDRLTADCSTTELLWNMFNIKVYLILINSFNGLVVHSHCSQAYPS